MLQKLILFLISAILFVGCGASAPTGETPSGAPETTAAVQVAESTESVTAGPAILDTEPEELPEAAEYFRFDLCTSTATADDGTVLLYATYTSPIFSSPDADRKQWVDGILNEIHQEFTINNVIDAISHSACNMAIDLDAKAIVVCSVSGKTAMLVSRFRTPVDIIGMTTDPKIWRRLSMSWGVTPVMAEQFPSMDVMFYYAKKATTEVLDLQPGDNILLTGGTINGLRGNTDTIKLETI